MIRMYCRQHARAATTGAAEAPDPRMAPSAAGAGLCPDCAALLDYSLDRIDACRFGADKPTCARCTVHCFRPAMREQIRAAMRYSGPRMTYRHPYLAVRHLLDRRREPRDRSRTVTAATGSAERGAATRAVTPICSAR